MSWWTDFRDTAEVIGTGGLALAFNDSAASKAGGLFNKITGRMSEDDKRNQQYAINDQIKAYKDATALSTQQLNDTRAEQNVEKRKINEKQIRSLRNNFRPAGGFLNNSANSSSLGGSNPLPNKLGTA